MLRFSEAVISRSSLGVDAGVQSGVKTDWLDDSGVVVVKVVGIKGDVIGRRCRSSRNGSAKQCEKLDLEM